MRQKMLKFNRYEVIEEFNSHMPIERRLSLTYKVKDLDRNENNYCILKVMNNNFQNGGEIIEILKILFIREIDILKSLTSLAKLHNRQRQIPVLRDCNDNIEIGNLYLAYEYIEGESLEKELVAGKRKTEEDTIDLLKEILDILSWIHKIDLMHRDIKPANIIRSSQDSKIILIDFGAGKICLEGSPDHVGTIIGTPGYQAPEQCYGKASIQSDIYSVGIIGIQSLTGKLPGSGDQHEWPTNSSGDPVWHKDAPNTSENIKNVLDRMVQRNLNDRYTSVSQILEDLSFGKKHKNPWDITTVLTPINFLPQWVKNRKISLKGSLSALTLLITIFLGLSLRSLNSIDNVSHNNLMYFSPDKYNFSVKYPSNWKKVNCEITEGCVVKFFHPKSQAELAVSVEFHSSQGKTLTEFNTFVSQKIEGLHLKYTKTLPEDVTSFGKEDIQAIRTTYMLSDEMLIKQTIINAVYDFKGYTISFSAPYKTYAQDEKLMNEMLDSFKFTQPGS